MEVVIAFILLAIYFIILTTRIERYHSHLRILSDEVYVFHLSCIRNGSYDEGNIRASSILYEFLLTPIFELLKFWKPVPTLLPTFDQIIKEAKSEKIVPLRRGN